MKSFLASVERISYVRLVVSYICLVPISLVLGWVSFYFPVYPIYTMLGLEFSNLGPIATLSWSAVFLLFVLTPAFVLALAFKVARQWLSKA